VLRAPTSSRGHYAHPHGTRPRPRRVTVALVPQTGGAVIEELLTPCRSAANRQKLTEFAGQVQSFRTAFDRLSIATGDVNPLTDAQLASELADALDCFRQWGLEGHSMAAIRTLLDARSETAKHLGEGHSSFRVLLTVVGYDGPVTLSSAAFLLETVRIVETAPFERLHFRLLAFEHERTRPMLMAAQREAQALMDAEVSLGKEYDLTTLAATHAPAHLLQPGAVLDMDSIATESRRQADRSMGCLGMSINSACSFPIRRHS
jgi:hypothetical protein